MSDLFPNGVWSYLTGGVLIGTGVGLVYLFTGRATGVSAPVRPT